jgi:hypothetical protein
MSLFKLTQSRYAHKSVIETIGGEIIVFNQRRLTHISREHSVYTVLIGIGYEVQWYITRGFLRFEEYPDEPLWTDEEEW